MRCGLNQGKTEKLSDGQSAIDVKPQEARRDSSGRPFVLWIL